MIRLSALVSLLLVALGGAWPLPASERPAAEAPDGLILWPKELPVYKHVVIVVEENKDFEQIIDEQPTEDAESKAPFINNTLRKEGALFTRMFGEEHHSQGNYFWLFSGGNHGVGFNDVVPDVKIKRAPNLATSLLNKGKTFAGYSEDLPENGSEVLVAPPDGKKEGRAYARKHVPWISFDDVPKECNLTFKEFPTKAKGFESLPTVAFVIPNLKNDMHDSDTLDEADVKKSIRDGDTWLKNKLGDYYAWAKMNNSLLIVTWDENDDRSAEVGLTDPGVKVDGENKKERRSQKDRQNRVCTIFAGARIKPGEYKEGNGITHVNILRTLEAMHGLSRAGAQQPNATKAGITEDPIKDVFK